MYWYNHYFVIERYGISGRSANEIASSVEAALRDGRLAPGDALPPVRALAAQLGVSPGTVAAAYRSLRERGVVETAGRHGTRIRSRPAVAPRMSLRLPVPAGVRDLSKGSPDPALLPDPAPLLARVPVTPVGYDAGGVLPELADLAKHRLAADQIPTPALTLTNGALDGIERLLATNLRPGDRIAVEDPGWANLLDLVAALNLQPVGVPMDQSGPSPDGLRRALAAGARAVVITSRSHNPTGVSVTAERANQLREVLADYPNCLVIEDDHAAELAIEPISPLAGCTQSWAFLRSVSKPYGPDLRLAVLAGDEATVARVTGRMRLGAAWVSTVLQHLVVAMWRDPAVTRLITHARQVYARRRESLIRALAERGITAYGRSGLNIWIPLGAQAHDSGGSRYGADRQIGTGREAAVVARLRDAGWAVAPGAMYRIASPPGIRVTISELRPEEVEPLADAILAAWHLSPTHPGV